MPRANSFRVFVSSTSKDLLHHRLAVREVLLESGHTPVMMEGFGALAAGTVAACRGLVASADVVIALCAYRRGWVPTRDEGGDGERSVTGLEIEAAQWLDIPVYWFLADESCWPGNLYEDDQEARDWVKRFHKKVNEPAGFFSPARVRAGQFERESLNEFRSAIERTLLKHQDAAQNKHTVKPPRVWTAAEEELEHVLPLLDEGIQAAPQVTGAALVADYQRLSPKPKDIATSVGPVQAAYVCASDLARAPRAPNGTVPLLEFVRSAARLLPARAERLTAWADGVAARLGETRPDQPIAAALGRGSPGDEPGPRRAEVSAALRTVQRALGAAVRSATDLTASAVRAAYWAAAPFSWEPLAEYQHDPVRAADDYSDNLAPAGLVNGAHPQLAFARLLLKSVPAAHHRLLDDAIRAAGRLLGEADPPPDPAPKPGPDPVAERAPSYLLVAAARTLSDPNKYQIHGWLDTPASGKPACLTDAGAVFTLDALPGALPAAIDQMRRAAMGRTNLDNLWVEVFLPTELLSQQVDQWKVTAGGVGGKVVQLPLGTLHPVVVRASNGHFCDLVRLGDRGERDEWRRALRKRWADPLRLTRHLPPADDGPGLVYHLPPAADIERLYVMLNGTNNVTGVALGNPSKAKSGAFDGWDELMVLVALGVPVVAWSRTAAEAPDELTGLLVGDPATLPVRLYEFRKNALGDPAHHGHSVAVLYDDPHRLPPDDPLIPPEELHG